MSMSAVTDEGVIGSPSIREVLSSGKTLTQGSSTEDLLIHLIFIMMQG